MTEADSAATSAPVAVLAAFAAVDAANRLDPNHLVFDGIDWPLAELQGVRGTYWLKRLASAPSAALLVAVRAHHLRRWTVFRSDYPQGRAGYHQWKRAAKVVHGGALEELCGEHLDPTLLARAMELVQRTGLGSDPDAQLVEDAVCLVFLETQFESLVDKIGREKVVDAVRKTAAKMSPAAVALADGAIRTDLGRSVLAQAVS